jgi:uncharacterized protein YbjT (DUF2867 family)
MNILLFGASGMVGQGVLRECLLDRDIECVQIIGRRATGVQSSKVREVILKDMSSYQPIEKSLTGFDACFFCLGVSSVGMKEADYERVTRGITMAAAEALSRLNPNMTFVYVSGMGTDSSESGRVMWARIKGRTENALLRLPFKAAYMFRPGFIQPLHGITSKTAWYQLIYRGIKPLVPILLRLFPDQILTTEQMGQAMLAVAKHGFEKRVLEVKDIRSAAASYAVAT